MLPNWLLGIKSIAAEVEVELLVVKKVLNHSRTLFVVALLRF